MLSLYVSSQEKINLYGLSDVLRLFFGPLLSQEPLSVAYKEKIDIFMHTEEGEENFCKIDISSKNISFSQKDGLEVLRDILKLENEVKKYHQMKRERKRLLYLVCSTLTGVKFPWGCLTGIRPSLVAAECMLLQSSIENNTRRFIESPLEKYLDVASIAYRLLTEYYFLTEIKAKLAIETAFYEAKIAEGLTEDKAAVYVGIPFCPSRCTYCSFSAIDGISRKEDVVEEYFQKLLEEIDIVCEVFRPKIHCLYIGGGTPTSLSARQLDLLFKKLAYYFPKNYTEANGQKHCTEWTLEAGRPDTMQEEKLWVAKKYGVDRICINPQTFHQKTLDKVNRSHAVEEIEKIYRIAQKIGFKDINMDLIAGLPNENLEDWQYNLECMEKLAPDSFTVHALCLKRKSTLGQKDKKGEILEIESVRKPSEEINEMQRSAMALAKKLSLYPYYMYRQKDGVGGLENVGYAKKGNACVYNVAMMGDQTSILGFGVGAMSKKKTGDKIERFAAYKGVAEYLKNWRLHALNKRDFFAKK